jgi:catechol 2,3-dioxygenase-like lactoylglutathione lyase family enzyme
MLRSITHKKSYLRRCNMLSNAKAAPTLPAVDIARARKFYEGKLGLKVLRQNDNELELEAGGGTSIYLYKRAATKADHTAFAFTVPDVEKEVKELKARGVVFEEYDLPGLKTVNSIATMDTEKAAWFKDTEGNIIGVGEFRKR